MKVRMILMTDAGEVLHIDEQRINPGYQLVCELGQPIVRYTPEATHSIFGFKLDFMERIEPRNLTPA